MSENQNKGAGFKRTLSNTHIQLIALGGTIGTGLFLGVGNSIQLSGPSVILTYAIVGAFMFLLMRALGELVLSDLSKHTYVDFIKKYLGNGTGFIMGYLYWISWVSLGMAELTAVGIYFKYWFPSVNTWVPGLIALAVLLIINIISAKFFGNLEFSFAIIKIITVLAFVVLIACLMIFHVKTDYTNISFAKLFQNNGFFANGPVGFLQGFQMVIFAFIGVEMIGFTASEAKDPDKTLPKAINEMPVRISLFYVLAIIAILVTVPWNHVSTSESPFVQALEATGIHGTGSIINFVVLSAAVSALNSYIYSCGRLLFSMTYKGKGKWNQAFGKLSKQQVPRNALIFSAFLIVLTPLITFLVGDKAFNFIASTSTSMFLIIWILMILTHMKYRKQTPANELPKFRLPAYPLLDYLMILFFIAIIVLLLILESFRIPMITALAITFILLTISKFYKQMD
ncbi:MAG: amino acid permease [Lactobacillus sp.]|nr:amino acid permease [Lactobacillus sp.]